MHLLIYFFIPLHEPSCGRRQVLEGEAKLDSWRSERTGFPEVVLGEGKSPEQIAAILRKMGSNDQVAMATRVTPQACATGTKDICRAWRLVLRSRRPFCFWG